MQHIYKIKTYINVLKFEMMLKILIKTKRKSINLFELQILT